mgnify:CR=1 FL=1|jgi:hypothetical protein
MVDEVPYENGNITFLALFVVLVLPALLALTIIGMTNFCDYIGDVHRISPTVLIVIIMFFIYKKFIKTE